MKNEPSTPATTAGQKLCAWCGLSREALAHTPNGVSFHPFQIPREKDPQSKATRAGQKSLDQWLDEIEQRANAATPGPWDFDTDDLGTWINNPGYPQPLAKMGSCTHFPKWDNARFIASSRSDVPNLVKALRELWENHCPLIPETEMLAEARRLSSILSSNAPSGGEKE